MSQHIAGAPVGYHRNGLCSPRENCEHWSEVCELHTDPLIPLEDSDPPEFNHPRTANGGELCQQSYGRAPTADPKLTA